ncbi:MAG: NAD(P)/FAD-dependent oxidoreductase [Candidatus Thorarchaeota archaeon]|nr:NAD(P)/FAD-dependent oxidoreductase [Candidatus Thorarchaeota archaeon]
MAHDLLIVGTGPAGLMTAERAAEYGLNTLVLERRKAVTDSLMGELVTMNALKLLRVKPGSEYIGNKYKAIVGESLDTGAKISVGEGLLGDSFILDEDRCQELMRNRAEANGTEFRYKSKVASVIKERAQVVGVRYNGADQARANLTVGADGSFSRVSETAGFTHPKWLLSYGIRWKLENCKGVDADTAYFYVGKDIGLGYLWLYPRSESEVNLGIGRVPSSKKNWENLPSLIDVLKKYKKILPGLRNSKIAAQNGGAVPCAGLIPKFADAGVALVGNAAGQVSSIVGGGVTTCFHAGTVLARHAKRAVEENDFSKNSLMKYEREYRRSKLAWSIQNTGKGFWAISKYARFNDPIKAAETVLSQLDAKTLNALVQGQAGVSDIMTLLRDFMPIVLTIGKGYLKSIAVSGF